MTPTEYIDQHRYSLELRKLGRTDDELRQIRLEPLHLNDRAGIEVDERYDEFRFDPEHWRVNHSIRLKSNDLDAIHLEKAYARMKWCIENARVDTPRIEFCRSRLNGLLSAFESENYIQNSMEQIKRSKEKNRHAAKTKHNKKAQEEGYASGEEKRAKALVLWQKYRDSYPKYALKEIDCMVAENYKVTAQTVKNWRSKAGKSNLTPQD